MVANDFKVQNTISMQLQRALRNPSRGINNLSISEKYNNIYIHFLTTNAGLALALRCVSSHILLSCWKGHEQLVLL